MRVIVKAREYLEMVTPITMNFVKVIIKGDINILDDAVFLIFQKQKHNIL